MDTTLTTSPVASRDANLRRYCTMGLGTAVLAGAVTTSDASVAFTNYNGLVLNDTVTTDTTSTNYGFDINGDGSQDFRFFIRTQGATSTGNYALIVAGVNGTSLKPINVVGSRVQGAQATYGYPSRLGPGALVGAARPFITLSLTSSGSFLQGGTFAFGAGFTNSKWKTAGSNSGYLGFSFSAADGLHYGFAQMTVAPQGSATLARSITLNSLAYETTPGLGITTFAVPEPSSIAMMAAGGVGLALYRRRKKTAAK